MKPNGVVTILSCLKNFEWIELSTVHLPDIHKKRTGHLNLELISLHADVGTNYYQKYRGQTTNALAESTATTTVSVSSQSACALQCFTSHAYSTYIHIPGTRSCHLLTGVLSFKLPLSSNDGEQDGDEEEIFIDTGYFEPSMILRVNCAIAVIAL